MNVFSAITVENVKHLDKQVESFFSVMKLITYQAQLDLLVVKKNDAHAHIKNIQVDSCMD